MAATSFPLEIERKYLIRYPNLDALKRLPQYSKTKIQLLASVYENGEQTVFMSIPGHTSATSPLSNGLNWKKKLRSRHTTHY